MGHLLISAPLRVKRSFLIQRFLIVRFLLLFFFVFVALPELFELLSGAPSYIELLNTDIQILVVRVLLGILVLVLFLIVALALLLARHSHQLLLLLELLLFTLDALLSLLVLGLNDGQGQVEQEKGTDEYHRHEEEERPWSVGLLVHDHNLGPALHSDALENIQEGPENIVKVGDVKVWVQRLLATEIASRAAT